MKYISLFSGIGGFEVAIHRIFPEAKCIGFSEIKKDAIKVYNYHFPHHIPIGDITKISNDELRKISKNGCDLLVGGFPCTNLSSMSSFAGDNSGLNGKNSGLFYEMIRVLSIVKPKYFIAENNNSMNKSNKEMITNLLENIYKNIHVTLLDSSDFGIQSRKRIFWTNFHIKNFPKKCTQEWSDVLIPISRIDNKFFLSEKMIQCMNTLVNTKNSKSKTRILKNNTFIDINVENKKSRWDLTSKSDTKDKKAKTFLGSGGGGNNILIYRENDKVIPRYYTPTEVERLFHFPDNYTNVNLSLNSRRNLLGNSVIIPVIEYILDSLSV